MWAFSPAGDIPFEVLMHEILLFPDYGSWMRIVAAILNQ